MPRSMTVSPRLSASAKLGNAAAKLARVRIGDGDRCTNHEGAVQSACRRAVGAGKLPAGEMALHDFEPRCHPLDTCQHDSGIVRHRHRCFQLEHDFRLDPRLHKPPQLHRGAPMGGKLDRVRPHVRPYRLPHAVARPDRAIGEADLAPHRLPPLRAAAALDLAKHRIAIRDTERGRARCDGRQRGRGVLGRNQMVGNRGEGGIQRHELGQLTSMPANSPSARRTRLRFIPPARS